MTEQGIKERRRYIEQVKASFGQEEKGQKDPMDLNTAEENAGFSFFKIKAMIAFLILAAFIYCDQYNISFQNYKTKTVIEKLQESIPVENIIQSIETML